MVESLLSEFGISHPRPMTLRCDNQAAIHISNNPIFHEFTKHIESDCHFIRDDILNGAIKTKHISSSDQLTDILTKALGRKEFDSFLSKLDIRDLHAPI